MEKSSRTAMLTIIVILLIQVSAACLAEPVEVPEEQVPHSRVVLERTHDEPVLRPTKGSWDEGWFVGSSIITTKTGDDTPEYYFYYEGGGNAGRQIGLAISRDTVEWKKVAGDPVLPKGPEGAWDSKYVTDPDVLIVDGRWLMYYVGSDGSAEKIGLATSRDGVRWTRYEKNPIFAPAKDGWDSANVMQPSVLYDGKSWRMYYGAFGTKERCVGVAASKDGIHWERYEGNPVLDLGKSGDWDDASAFGADVKMRDGAGSRFEMFYTGATADRQYRIGRAVSDDGIKWRKDPGPSLERSAKGSWDWFKTSIPTPVWHKGSQYIFYSGNDGEDYVGVGRTKVVEKTE